MLGGGEWRKRKEKQEGTSLATYARDEYIPSNRGSYMARLLLQVNYVKTIDQYLIGCFLFVFATLAEYSLVLFLAARMKRYQQTKEYKNEKYKKMQLDASGARLLLSNGGSEVVNRVCTFFLLLQFFNFPVFATLTKRCNDNHILKVNLETGKRSFYLTEALEYNDLPSHVVMLSRREVLMSFQKVLSITFGILNIFNCSKLCE